MDALLLAVACETNRERAIDVRARLDWIPCRLPLVLVPGPGPGPGLLLVIAGVICRAQRCTAHMAMAPAAASNIFHSIPSRSRLPSAALIHSHCFRTQLPHAGPRRAVSVRPTSTFIRSLYSLPLQAASDAAAQ